MNNIPTKILACFYFFRLCFCTCLKNVIVYIFVIFKNWSSEKKKGLPTSATICNMRKLSNVISSSNHCFLWKKCLVITVVPCCPFLWLPLKQLSYILIIWVSFYELLIIVLSQFTYFVVFCHTFSYKLKRNISHTWALLMITHNLYLLCLSKH
jgi:hypothetical protein